MFMVRLGFVTNSSSTTHIMMWKGDKEALRELLEAHAKHFDLHYTGWGDEDGQLSVTADEVTTAILSCLESKVQSASEFAADCREQAERNREYVENENKERAGSGKWMEPYVKKDEDMARRADEYDHVLKVDFGDNHGDFQGGALGMTMDYEGRSIRIVDAERGFYYTTEQNR